MPPRAREFDLDAKAFVDDGFVLPEAKSGAEWLDADTLLLSSAYGEGMATTSGYARTVRLWRRGTDVARAPVVFETSAGNMRVFSDVDRTDANRRVWFIEQLDFFNYNLWLGDESGASSKLDLPTDIWMQAHGDWFTVKLRSAWTAGGTSYAPDTVLGISLSAFLAGDRRFATILEPASRRALQGMFWAAGKLVLADPRRIATGLRSLDAVHRWLDLRQPAGITQNRHDRRLASRCRRGRRQWRPARQHPGSVDAVVAVADRRLRQPDIAEAGAAHASSPRGLSSPSTKPFRSTANAFPMCRPDQARRPEMRRSI